MVKQNQLSKTCFNCGLQKQLSAFLQISGPEGTSYGNICSTCRGSGLGKEIVIPEKENEERQSSSSTGLKIDAKTKVHIEFETKQRLQNQKETEIKETKKRESTKEELLERKEKKNEAEQKHRQAYIEPKKKDGFLNYQSTKPAQKLITAPEKEAVIKKAVMDQHGILQTLHKEELAKHEEKVKGMDLVNIDVDLSQPLEKTRSAEFNKAAKAQAWLRTGAVHTTSQFLTKNPAAQKTAEVAHPENRDDALVDALKEVFEPNSPGSRRR
jgi:hypothetical protein